MKKYRGYRYLFLTLKSHSKTLCRKHQTSTQTRASAKGTVARRSLFSFTVIPPSSHTEASDLKKSNDLDKATWFRPDKNLSLWMNPELWKKSKIKILSCWTASTSPRWLNGRIDGFCELIAALERHHLHLGRRVVCSPLWCRGENEMCSHTMWLSVKFPQWRQTAEIGDLFPIFSFYSIAGRALKRTAVARVWPRPFHTSRFTSCFDMFRMKTP